mmetsp:Transcript_9534/g.20100  ORF Transcript_9534/g.20100 Transcript_9534/m.20100 type:complete len:215 (-) Transcript_9534:117-761(-)
MTKESAFVCCPTRGNAWRWEGRPGVNTMSSWAGCQQAGFVRNGHRRSVARVKMAGVWFENAVETEIQAPREFVFDLYSDLEKMPAWSPWLDSVVVDELDETVSTWKLAARGVNFSWRARNTEVRSPDIIAWISEDGLANRGRVTFRDSGPKGDHTKLRLAVAFQMPSAVAGLVQGNDYVRSFVQRTLMADVTRFRSIALREHRRVRMLANQDSR